MGTRSPDGAKRAFNSEAGHPELLPHVATQPRITALRAFIRATCLGAIVLLSACATHTTHPTLPPDQIPAAEARQQAREDTLRAQGGFSLAGRVAVSSNGKGGSGRIDWEQHGSRFAVALSAPVTRQSWRLSGDDGGAKLEGLEGGRRDGPNATDLLREATGWDIPFVALGAWLRGLRAETEGPARLQFDAAGRVMQIQQGDWTINYVWPESIAADALPQRLDASRDSARVRLIVDEWSPAP